MKHDFLPEAEAEYLRAIAFYEEKHAGLGLALIEEFERIVSLAAERPDAWKAVHASGIRRIGLKRFPFAVFLQSAAASLIVITAFAHHRQRPGYWLGRSGV